MLIFRWKMTNQARNHYLISQIVLLRTKQYFLVQMYSQRATFLFGDFLSKNYHIWAVRYRKILKYACFLWTSTKLRDKNLKVPAGSGKFLKWQKSYYQTVKNASKISCAKLRNLHIYQFQIFDFTQKMPVFINIEIQLVPNVSKTPQKLRKKSFSAKSK